IVRFMDRAWPIEITLTNREDMLFRLLLGRTAMAAGGLIVDPGKSFIGGRALRRAYLQSSQGLPAIEPPP
ncbi:MAG: RimK/LysX family protein, partial [Gammaproteobacteria bacterium]